MSKTIVAAFFILGLAIRIALIPTTGSDDIAAYAKWGAAVGSQGLAQAFEGIYFPIQYLVFAAVDAVA